MTSRFLSCASVALCMAVPPLLPVSAAASPGYSFTGLGDLPGGNYLSRPEGISADGSVVVGSSGGANGVEAFRWTKATGMEGLGDLPSGEFFSRANAVSADGLTIVGGSDIAFDEYIGREAFRWTAATGMQGIGYYPPDEFMNPYAFALAVSGDGSVVVGETDAPAGASFRVGFYWTEEAGFRTLSAVSQVPIGMDEFDNVTDISDDGSVIVGGGQILDGGGNYQAYMARVNAQGALLGYLPGGSQESGASAISGDGAVIVGYSDSSAAGGENEAFRWTEAGGMQGLGSLPGGNNVSRALDVS